jgi:formate dehydrogenase subunit gamma
VKSSRVQRFAKTTRWLHWTFALSFLALAASGGALALREVLGLGDAGTDFLVALHLRAAVALVTAPGLVFLSGDTATTLADLREAVRWSREDLLWLKLQPLALLGRAELPPAGKLNAGQKVNALASMGIGLGLAASGLWLWSHPGSLVAWFLHLVLFAFWIPLFAGHLSLALVVPSTRPALRGILDGTVDREWARHHHALWLEELEATEHGDG